MRRHHGDHAVAEGAQAVQPGGTPISHSTKAGFNRRGKVWTRSEHPLPGGAVSGSGREKAETATS